VEESIFHNQIKTVILVDLNTGRSKFKEVEFDHQLRQHRTCTYLFVRT